MIVKHCTDYHYKEHDDDKNVDLTREKLQVLSQVLEQFCRRV